MNRFRWFPLVILGLLSGASAQQRRVTITVDDLPYVSHTHTALAPADVKRAREVNQRLLSAFKKHQVPVTGFVTEGRVQALGPDAGVHILTLWIANGLDLGNHTYSHADINGLAVSQIEDEILRGETTVAPLMKGEGKRLEFFRFPMNHTGDTKAKHDLVAVFLAQHGYKLATCTIENSDYLFNDAYVRILERHHRKAAKKLRLEYLAYTSCEIDYYASLNKQVLLLGYEPPEVMLLHDNRLNADVINSLLELFVRKN
jgi:peptidoglycan/xylan/chitin deacetylase (PgdA/CDA1 family)